MTVPRQKRSRGKAAARHPDAGNGVLLATGDHAAFITGVLAAAADMFRWRGEGLVKFAERAPETSKQLGPAIKAAQQNMTDAGCWLIATADAIGRALDMPDEDPVARLNSDTLEEAIEAFGRYCEMQVRGRGAFQELVAAAMLETQPMGRA